MPNNMKMMTVNAIFRGLWWKGVLIWDRGILGVLFDLLTSDIVSEIAKYFKKNVYSSVVNSPSGPVRALLTD